MIIKTKSFGNVEVNETDIIDFPEGMPGFSDEKKFVVLFDKTKEDSPFMWLQAVENSDLAFVVVDPFWFKPDYKFNIDAETKKQLEISAPEDVLVLSVVVVPEDMSRTTANLKAPLLLNHRARKGKQYILQEDKYSIRHYIVDEIERNFSSVVMAQEEKSAKKSSTRKKSASCKSGNSEKKSTCKTNSQKTSCKKAVQK